MRRYAPFVIALLFVSVQTQARAAATFRATGSGIDSPSCGSAAAPCRSISQAITNAAAGDTIEVGPGVYGDLTDNEDFQTPGEEAGGPACGPGVICLDKPLTIMS